MLQAIYIICLVAIYRGPLIKIPCYQLMFYNGVVDVLDLIVGSFIAAYFHFVICFSEFLKEQTRQI